MTTSPTNLKRLLNDLDALKPESQPLPPHTASACDAHSRETYATFLATVLLSDAAISAAQSRVFKMLLASLQLGDAQGRLFERAQAMDQDGLREFARVIGENKLDFAFFTDALVLSRLDAPLTETRQELICELADFLNFPKGDLSIAANLAAMILGLPLGADVPIGIDSDKVAVWHDYLYCQLTAKSLATGKLTGWWEISEALSVETAWSMENAQIRFTEDGSIKTKAMGVVSIDSCYLVRPIMEFIGDKGGGQKLTVRINDSNISGCYAQDAGSTAITFINFFAKDDSPSSERYVKFNNLTVSTVNARSFLLFNVSATFDHCHFTDCGSPVLVGGAIMNLGNTSIEELYYRIYISNSSFVRCIAKLGGGVRAYCLHPNAIVNSSFEDCISLAYHPNNIDKNLETFAFSGGAIFADRTKPVKVTSSIIGCNFNNTSVQLGYNDDGGSTVRSVTHSKFIASYVAYFGSTYHPTETCYYKNILNNSGEISTSFEKYQRQDWWSKC